MFGPAVYASAPIDCADFAASSSEKIRTRLKSKPNRGSKYALSQESSGRPAALRLSLDGQPEPVCSSPAALCCPASPVAGLAGRCTTCSAIRSASASSGSSIVVNESFP